VIRDRWGTPRKDAKGAKVRKVNVMMDWVGPLIALRLGGRIIRIRKRIISRKGAKTLSEKGNEI
jgi:hypothetical protein